MTSAIQSVPTPSTPIQPPGVDARAAFLLGGNAGRHGLDLAGVRRDLEQARAQDPTGATALATAVEARLTPVQRGELARAGEARPASADPAALALDLGQMALDIAGIFDPSGVADGTNAAISGGRAVGSAWSGQWREAGGHLLAGGISALGIVAGVGDLAKLGKIGRWAQTVADAVRAVRADPALRATLEPGLRKIHDAVNAIPAGALERLPAGARGAIERMRSQLDGLFGGGTQGGRVFVTTDKGVAVSTDLLKLQGTSRLVGDFRGIKGATVEEIVSRVPKDWRMIPQDRGAGIKFVDASGAERLRLHAPSHGGNAPAGSNSASGWTARVHVPGTTNSYYDSAGAVVGPRANEGHIPIHGNPNALRP